MDDYPYKQQAIQQRYELLRPVLDERTRRLWAATEAMALGTGGVGVLSKVTGLSRSTIRAGVEQLKEPALEHAALTSTGRVRKPGAGRKSAIEKERGIEEILEGLLESRKTEGTGSLLWTCKSLRKLAEELGEAGYQVSYRTVGNILHRLGYSFGQRGDYKKYSFTERFDIFCTIAEAATEFLAREEPLLSVRLQAPPQAVEVSHLVIAGLLSWWRQSGLQRYPRAQRMLLAVENAVDRDAWAASLKTFTDEAQIEVDMTHFPPGAWRWQRSVRQAVCFCSLPGGAREGAEIGATLDLVLPGKGLLS